MACLCLLRVAGRAACVHAARCPYRIASADSLHFSVWDKDIAVSDFLGKAVLEAKQFLPDGFHGDLSLESAGKGITATLAVKVRVFQDGTEDAVPTPATPPSINKSKAESPVATPKELGVNSG